jgi:hypothetical protein
MLMDILAGIVCGLAMGTVILGAGIFILFSSRNLYERLGRRLPQGISPTLVMLAALFAVPPTGGMFGAIAGALYNIATESAPGSGLGSPNLIFTMAILIVAALAMLPALILLLIKRRKWGYLLIVMNLAFAGIFGWLLPILANWR